MALQETGNQYYTLHHADPATNIELRDKFTANLIYTKLRHTVHGAYAISLVEPDSGAVMVELQAQSAASKEKVAMLRNPEAFVLMKDTGDGVNGFKWTFQWEGEIYQW